MRRFAVPQGFSQKYFNFFENPGLPLPAYSVMPHSDSIQARWKACSCSAS